MNKNDIDVALVGLGEGVEQITDAATASEKVMDGIGDRILAAVDAALAANPGITPEQLQGITDEGTALKAAAVKLGESIVANTVST